MADKITTNPQRSEPVVNKDGLPTDQAIEWNDDIELALNENLLGVAVQFRSYTVAQLTGATPEIPASLYLDKAVIVSNESGGRTLATSDGTNWKRVADGNNIS